MLCSNTKNTSNITLSGSLPGKVNCDSCCVTCTWGEGWAGEGGVGHDVMNSAGEDGVEELHDDVFELESGT